MKHVFDSKHVRALAILIAIVLLLEVLFGGVRVTIKRAAENIAWSQQAATAAACTSASDFALPVAHAVCQPPGAPPKGRDGVKCGVQTLPNGTSITGICVAGCCKGVAYSSGQNAVSSFLSGLGGIGQNILVQGALGLVGQLIGGGGSGGGGGGYAYDGGYAPIVEEEPYLTSDVNLEGGTDDFSLAFGSGGTTNGTSLTYTDGENAERNADASTEPADAQGAPAAEDDGVTTAYEYLKTLTQSNNTDSEAAAAEEEFEEDYFGTSLSDSPDIVYEGGLSIADLELGGLQQAERARGYDDAPPVFGGIDDYRSSAVVRSDSKVDVNPLSNTRFDELAYEEETPAPTWWQQLVLLIGQMLGFGSPEA